MLTEIIEQLRNTICKNVFGVYDLRKAMEQSNTVNELTLYVTENSQELSQFRNERNVQIKHSISIYAALPVNDADERFEGALHYLMCFRDMILKSIWGFQPTGKHCFDCEDHCTHCRSRGGMYYIGSQPVEIINGILFYVYEFELIEDLSAKCFRTETSHEIEIGYKFNIPCYDEFCNKIMDNNNERKEHIS